MRKSFSVYDQQTGALLGIQLTVPCGEDGAIHPHDMPIVADGTALIEGHHDHLSKRVVPEAISEYEQALAEHRSVGTTVALTSEAARGISARVAAARARTLIDYQPPQPSADHEWNAAAKRWLLTHEAELRQTKQRQVREQIVALELSQHRPMRELMQDPSNAEARKRLAAIDLQISALREELSQ